VKNCVFSEVKAGDGEEVAFTEKAPRNFFSVVVK